MVLVRLHRYVQFSFVHQEVTKVVCQHVVVSMLTMYIMPVPPQLRIMLFSRAESSQGSQTWLVSMVMEVRKSGHQEMASGRILVDP